MTKHSDFELLRVREIPEINTRALLYRHIRTGAQVLSLVKGNGLVVVMGSQEAIRQANEARPGWLEPLKVLW